MENNENVNNPVNESNNASNNNSNKIIVLLLILAVVCFGGYFAYTNFVAKDESKNINNNPASTPIITPTNTPYSYDDYDYYYEKDDFGIIRIGEDNVPIEFNGKIINLRSTESELYIDDKKEKIDYYGVDGAFVTDNFILLRSGNQSGYVYPYAINKEYKLVNVNGNPDGPFCSIHDIRLENDKVLAIESCGFDYNEDDNFDKEIEFVYEINQITIEFVEE